jgi:NarL family two-component system response regulator LiaR
MSTAEAPPGISPRIRVFVVDDHPMVRAGLGTMIRSEPGLEFAGEAGHGADAIRLIPQAAADVVLVDLIMPQVDGVGVIAALRERVPYARFVILTSSAEPSEVRRALDAGAAGYLLKSASAQELINVIRTTHAGQRVLAPEVAEAIVARANRRTPGHDLTQRERELLVLMASGLNNQEIANKLQIALPTVKFHVTNILAKLHANNRTEAVLTALKYKLVPPA